MTDETKIQPENKTPHLFKITTLAEQGPNFPIAPLVGGKPVQDRSFSFLEWDMKMEERVSAARQKAKSVGQFVNSMFGLLLDRFCGQDFQAMTEGERTLKINQLEFSNVMYAYVWLRADELGPELKMDITCPSTSCGKLNKDFVADLNTLEIHVKDAEHQRTVDYILHKPISTKDGKIITGLKLDISKWDALERVDKDNAGNEGAMKRLMFESAVSGLLDAKGPIEGFHDVKTIIQQLKKRDIEQVIRAVVENNAGPHMALKGECVHCKGEFFKMLDWKYDYFFDSSSL